MALRRREFFTASTASLALGAATSMTSCAPPSVYEAPSNGSPFHLGVLSGLHSETEVVLWTRLSPDLAPGVGEIRWEVATDPQCVHLVQNGRCPVGPVADWTAKVLVGGLEPDTNYWYRFVVDDQPSAVGRARTLPVVTASPSSLKLVFGSCQNWGSGFYNAWTAIANEAVDAVVWLGDYIYETPSLGSYIGDLGAVLNATQVRRDTLPEATTLDLYRAKYKLYRSDPELQRAHGAHPFVPVWDDHEFKNDYNRMDLSREASRAAAAYQAWFEYMPVMAISGNQIYRSLRWGRLAELTMIDTRQYRDPQANGHSSDTGTRWVGVGTISDEAQEPNRTILGPTQRAWLLDRLGAAQQDDVTWKLIGNQVMIAPVRPIDLDTAELRQLVGELPRHNGVYINMDSWESYRWERDLLLEFLRTEQIRNVSFLTGDIHMFWQQTLRSDYDDDSSPYVANDFVGGSISSPGLNVLGEDFARGLEQYPGQWSPSFRYVDFRRNGYGLVDLTPESMSVSYRATNVTTPRLPTVTSARFTMTNGQPYPSLELPNP